jgi:predicted MPP superfamily phosphohydrolase
MFFVILYHFLMFGVDLLFLREIRNNPLTSVLFLSNLAKEFLAAILLGVLIKGLDINLIVHGLAWHGSFYLLGTALLIRQQKIDGKRRIVLPLAIFLFSLIYVGVAVDALLVEPTALVVKQHSILTSKITKPMKIVFLADFQTDRIGWYEKKTLKLVKKQNADLILLGGDYLQVNSKEHEDRLMTEFNSLLKEIDLDAPYGVYAIQGNQESYTWNNWTRFFKGTKITPITRTISLNVGEIRLTLLGMHSSFSNRSFYDRNPEDRFRIIVGHAPIFALSPQWANLLLAGHTHGGQVQIPGYGAVITMSPELPKEWASGVTNLPNGSTLIVSHGSGLERGYAPRIRFFCRPDFLVIELVPEKSPILPPK